MTTQVHGRATRTRTSKEWVADAGRFARASIETAASLTFAAHRAAPRQVLVVGVLAQFLHDGVAGQLGRSLPCPRELRRHGRAGHVEDRPEGWSRELVGSRGAFGPWDTTEILCAHAFCFASHIRAPDPAYSGFDGYSSRVRLPLSSLAKATSSLTHSVSVSLGGQKRKTELGT